mmetsp:Transcript_76844/g.207337  ORF Transcript_76844/g.207337 Transcript_76844/m.207337 type:complete len:287 (+) Transcript_76844:2220-3080(+)
MNPLVSTRITLEMVLLVVGSGSPSAASILDMSTQLRQPISREGFVWRPIGSATTRSSAVAHLESEVGPCCTTSTCNSSPPNTYRICRDVCVAGLEQSCKRDKRPLCLQNDRNPMLKCKSTSRPPEIVSASGAVVGARHWWQGLAPGLLKKQVTEQPKVHALFHCRPPLEKRRAAQKVHRQQVDSEHQDRGSPWRSASKNGPSTSWRSGVNLKNGRVFGRRSSSTRLRSIWPLLKSETKLQRKPRFARGRSILPKLKPGGNWRRSCLRRKKLHWLHEKLKKKRSLTR